MGCCSRRCSKSGSIGGRQRTHGSKFAFGDGKHGVDVQVRQMPLFRASEGTVGFLGPILTGLLN